VQTFTVLDCLLSVSRKYSRHVLFKSLAVGLKYLHERGIIHRDLKPHNLLLTDRTASAELKIADFGFARFATDMMESFLGSPLYMAPEMIRRERYSSKSDLWSVGVIFYEMLTGKTPYHDAKSHHELAEMVMKQSITFPSRISPLCRELLAGLLQKKPKERITWESFFEHKFLQPAMSDSSILDNQDTWLQTVFCFENHGEEKPVYVTSKTLIIDIKRALHGAIRVAADDQLLLDSEGLELEDHLTVEFYKFNTKRKPMYLISRRWLRPAPDVPVEETAYTVASNVDLPAAISRSFSQTLQSIASSNPGGSLPDRLNEYEQIFNKYADRVNALYQLGKTLLIEIFQCMKAHDVQMKVYLVLRTYTVLRGGKLAETFDPVRELFTAQERRIQKVVDSLENVMKVMKATQIDPALAASSNIPGAKVLLDAVDEKSIRDSFKILVSSFDALRKDYHTVTGTIDSAPKLVEAVIARTMDSTPHKEMHKQLEDAKNVVATMKKSSQDYMKLWSTEKDRISRLRHSITSDTQAEQQLVERLLQLEQSHQKMDQYVQGLFTSLQTCLKSKPTLEKEFFRGLQALAVPHEDMQNGLVAIAARIRPALADLGRRAADLDTAVLQVPEIYSNAVSELNRRQFWTTEVCRRIATVEEQLLSTLQSEFSKRESYQQSSFSAGSIPTVVGLLFPQLLPGAPHQTPDIKIVSVDLDPTLLPRLSDSADSLILEDDFSLIMDIDKDPAHRIADLERENARLKLELQRSTTAHADDAQEKRLLAGFRRVEELELQVNAAKQTFGAMNQELEQLREERKLLQQQLRQVPQQPPQPASGAVQPQPLAVNVMQLVQERNDLLAQLNALQAYSNNLQQELRNLQATNASLQSNQNAGAAPNTNATVAALKRDLEEAHKLIEQLLSASGR
jgi:serine/threonine protein kinase